MYLRLFSVKVNYKNIADYFHFYKNKALPEFAKANGCQFAGLLENMEDAERMVSITLWNRFEQSGQFESTGLEPGIR